MRRGPFLMEKFKMMHIPQLQAGGPIKVARFIGLDTTGTGTPANHSLLPKSDAKVDFVIGVSSEGAHLVPNPGLALADQLAAEAAGDNMEWFPWGQTARVFVGEAITEPGVLLKSGTDAKAELADATADVPCALALEVAAIGNLALVWILPPTRAIPA
jgi:hypothetical protein